MPRDSSFRQDADSIAAALQKAYLFECLEVLLQSGTGEGRRFGDQILSIFQRQVQFWNFSWRVENLVSNALRLYPENTTKIWWRRHLSKCLLRLKHFAGYRLCVLYKKIVVEILRKEVVLARKKHAMFRRLDLNSNGYEAAYYPVSSEPF